LATAARRDLIFSSLFASSVVDMKSPFCAIK
jgi:hypothetical protein